MFKLLILREIKILHTSTKKVLEQSNFEDFIC